MPSRPPSDEGATSVSSPTVSTSPSGVTYLIRPVSRSETKASPFGRNAMSHGDVSPVAIVSVIRGVGGRLPDGGGSGEPDSVGDSDAMLGAGPGLSAPDESSSLHPAATSSRTVAMPTHALMRPTLVVTSLVPLDQRSSLAVAGSPASATCSDCARSGVAIRVVAPMPTPDCGRNDAARFPKSWREMQVSVAGVPESHANFLARHAFGPGQHAGHANMRVTPTYGPGHIRTRPGSVQPRGDLGHDGPLGVV